MHKNLCVCVCMCGGGNSSPALCFLFAVICLGYADCSDLGTLAVSHSFPQQQVWDGAR